MSAANAETWKHALLTRDRPRVATFVAGLRHPVRPETVCGMHCHPAIEIVYHPVGRGRTLLNGRSLEFAENSIVIYAPGELHDQAMFMAGEDLCVQLAVPDAVSPRLRAGFYLADLKVPWIIEGIRQLSRRSTPASGVERGVLDLQATSILLGLIGAEEAASPDSVADGGERHVRKAELFVQEHFSSIRALAEVAEHVQISHGHLRHLFKSLRGKPLVCHLNSVRVSRAKFLLANSPLPLKQIAVLCGFRDEYYFSNVFRRFAAVPPRVYRLNASLD